MSSLICYDIWEKLNLAIDELVSNRSFAGHWLLKMIRTRATDSIESQVEGVWLNSQHGSRVGSREEKNRDSEQTDRFMLTAAVHQTRRSLSAGNLLWILLSGEFRLAKVY